MRAGQRCGTPLGAGTIVWWRFGPPNFNRAEAVSVLLDARRLDHSYVGTVFPADRVELEEVGDAAE